MNMVFSGVAGSRPAREGLLADGDGQRTIKGREIGGFRLHTANSGLP
jgi:hypothetical protein